MVNSHAVTKNFITITVKFVVLIYQQAAVTDRATDVKKHVFIIYLFIYLFVSKH